MTMLAPLVLLVTVLAVAWVTRFVTKDELAEPFRLWVVNRTGAESKWSYLTFCPWCVSIWLGPPIVAAAFILDHWVTYMVLTWLAASYVVGMLSQLDRG